MTCEDPDSQHRSSWRFVLCTSCSLCCVLAEVVSELPLVQLVIAIAAREIQKLPVRPGPESTSSCFPRPFDQRMASTSTERQTHTHMHTKAFIHSTTSIHSAVISCVHIHHYFVRTSLPWSCVHTHFGSVQDRLGSTSALIFCVVKRVWF